MLVVLVDLLTVVPATVVLVDVVPTLAVVLVEVDVVGADGSGMFTIGLVFIMKLSIESK